MFEQFRRSLEDLLQRATLPEERHLIVSRMKDTLVQASMGVDDMRDALKLSRRKLEAEQRELETVRRRRELATSINDAETMQVAERFEKQHAERVAILEAKVEAQARELEMAERDLATMKAELRAAMTAGPAGAGPLPGAEPEDPLEDEAARGMRQELNSLERERARAERSADADRRLEELKKKMGK